MKSDDAPLEANNIVDKFAAVNDDPDWLPRDKMELSVALQQIVASVDERDIPNMYAALKRALEQTRVNSGDETMSKKVQTEAQLRAEIRKILREAMGDELPPPATPVPEEKPTKKPRKKSINADKENLQQIADELGLKVSGAKRLVDWTLAKLNWLVTEFPGEQLDLLVLQIANDYVEDLIETGELDAEEAQLLRDNVDMLMNSPDFLEYFNYEVKQFPGYKEGLYKYLGKDPKTGRNIK